jgi:polyferredoxin
LFGLADASGALIRPGALDWLAAQPAGGALLLAGAHALPPGAAREGVARLLSERAYRAVDSHGAAVGPVKALPAAVRLLLTSDAAAGDVVGDFASSAASALRTIKVPPLRVRRADLAATAEFVLRLATRQRGRAPAPAPAIQFNAPPPPARSAEEARGAYAPPPALSRAARHLLESADFPNNDRELESLMRAALAHAAATAAPASSGGAAAALASSPLPSALDADMLWSPAWSQKLSRSRADLFSAFPQLRAAMRSAAWPDWLNQNVTRWAFPVVVFALMAGPQAREHNAALNVFWAWWWPAILALYPFVGRLWCAVCPFMIYGEWAQKIAVAAGHVPGPWPREAAERYGGWFLYGLFAAILLWEELWHLDDTAALSGWLLLLITAGAVACSVLFERRLWCRYLCPIGGMNGMFAKLAVIELRGVRGVCTAECSTYGCVRGGPAVPASSAGCDRGLPTTGCPLYSHPANLTDNRDCTLCGSCVKACPHGAVELRLRPPGADLWSPVHSATAEEVALMFLLLGAVGVHRLERAALLTFDWLAGMQSDASLAAAQALLAHFPTHAALSAALLALPGVVAWGADAAVCGAAAGARAAAAAASGSGTAAATPPGWAAEAADGTQAFVRLAYGWLPFVWAASLAHYTQLFGAEAGHVLPAAADLLHLPPFIHDAMPSGALAPPVIAFLQTATLAGGGAAATALTLHLGRAFAYAPARVATQCAAIFGAGALLLPLIVQSPFLQ